MWWWHLIEVLIFVVLMVFDLTSKSAVAIFLDVHDGNHTLIKGFIDLTYSENTGAGWGMFKEHTIVLIVITTICMAVVFAYLLSARKANKLLRVPLILILAGGLGNLVDRIWLGYVRDFIEFTFFEFPIFNLADNFLTIGAAWLIIYLIVEIAKEAKTDKKNTSDLSGMNLQNQNDMINEVVGAVTMPKLDFKDYVDMYFSEFKWRLHTVVDTEDNLIDEIEEPFKEEEKDKGEKKDVK